MITLTLEGQPENATRWSTRQGEAGRPEPDHGLPGLAGFGPQPHGTETFKLSTDPAFDKVRDVVGLYMVPPHRAVVLCIDETSQIQVLTGICLSRQRRQQVRPEPQPISRGSDSHGVPEPSTNRMPVSAARSDLRGRPPSEVAGSGSSSGAIPSRRAATDSVRGS